MAYDQLKRIAVTVVFCLGMIAAAIGFGPTSSIANVTCGTNVCVGCGSGTELCNYMSCCNTADLPCSGDETWTQECLGEAVVVEPL